jgi:restriction endonuclease S subunit
VFLLLKGNLERRLDPNFYKPSTISFIEKLVKGKYSVRKLKDVTKKVVDGPFGTQLKVDDYCDEGVPVIRVSNLRTGIVSEDKLVKITPEKHLDIFRSRVLPNDVLLTKAGAILGYSAVFPEHLIEGNITSHLVTITCKPELKPDYLKYIFQSKVGKLQIYRWGNKATRPELNTGEVKQILIPVPAFEIQDLVINKMDLAYRQQVSKNEKAKVIVKGIDKILMNELEIQMPSLKKERKFFVKSKAVSSSRFDPSYHQPVFQDLIKAVENGEYATCYLKTLITFIESGSRPPGGVSLFETGVLSLGGEHVNSFCEINTEKPKFIPTEFHESILSTETKFNDILLVKDGATTGKVGIIKELEHIGVNINEHVFLLRVNQKVIPEYLLYFLNSALGKAQIKREITGATVTGLTKQVVRHLRVPLPALEKQKQIVDEIDKIRQEAKQLEKEALLELNKARLEVEELILKES